MVDCERLPIKLHLPLSWITDYVIVALLQFSVLDCV